MTQERTVVDRLYLEFQEIVDSLDPSQVSLRIAAEAILQKSLLIAAGSHFEYLVKAQILSLTRKHSGQTGLLLEFVRNKAIERQFHTYFNWRGNNANQFFGFFGSDFRRFMDQQIQANDEYRVGIRAFLELERERNRIVHEDFGNSPLEKTSEQIFDLYRSARVFVGSLETFFDEFVQQEVRQAGSDS